MPAVPDPFAHTPCAAGCVRGHGDLCHARTARAPRFCELIAAGRDDYGRLVDHLSAGGVPAAATSVPPPASRDPLASYAWGRWPGPSPSGVEPTADRLRVAVPAGIGDAFWVYQLLSPHCRTLDVEVRCCGTTAVQRRSEPFLRLLPKVGDVTYRDVPPADYDRLGRSVPDLTAVLSAPDRPHEFAANEWLESGHRLEGLGPVAWGVDVRSAPPVPPLPWSSYAVAYASGYRPACAWEADGWVRLIAGLWRKHGLSWPVAVIGAGYDRGEAEAIVAGLRGEGIAAEPSIHLPADQVVGLIRGAEWFVGYQSGLNVLADNFSVPQVMVYFDYLRPMMGTWCRPGHAEGGVYQAGTFNERPEGLIERLAPPPPPGPLEYCPAKGVARLREAIGEPPYDAAYFAKYRDYQDTEIGRALNDFRVSLAAKYAGKTGGVLDVGIGAGTFLDRLGDRPKWGCDVNPAGVAWLHERGLWHDPHEGLPECCRVVTFHDSLEHIRYPGELLSKFRDGVHVIVSIPVFPDLARIAESKHFRVDEHEIYFSADGLVAYFADLGYERVETSWRETELGRESIMTGVFRKGAKPRLGSLAETIALAPGGG